MASDAPAEDDFHRLLAFRDALRQFVHWSEQQALSAGVTPAQYQLLLAIRGHGSAPTVGDVAYHLLLRHHSVVGLVDRAERAGLVTRRTDDRDHRVVRLALTPTGRRLVSKLAASHLDELTRLDPHLRPLWK